jgi:hypothetical protein
MSIINLITTVSLAVALITMITSNQLSIYASPTTEDDGWTEGDYEGSQEEQEERAKDDWEDAGRPGETDDVDDENDEDNDDNDDGLVECEDGSLVETEELCEHSEALVTCSDGSSAATQAECPPEPVSSFVTCSDGSSAVALVECPSVPTATQEQLQTCQGGSIVSVNEACPKPETLTCPDGTTVSVDEDCPPTDKPLPDCDGSFQDCKTQGEFVCPAGSAAHECELPEPVSRKLPDNECLFNTELPKCASTDGKCPDGFGMNEDDRCFPQHSKCPEGFHTTEDDETGECNRNSECEGDDYLLDNDGKNCRERHTYCKETPTPHECKDKEKGKEHNVKTINNQKTTVINSASATASASITAAEVSNCKLNGNTDGIQQKFNPVRYQACGLYTSADKAYYDGFVAGCMQVGNTKLICETVANSNIVSPSVQTHTAAEPTQAIQPAAVS